jgi:hypothetical protein
LLTDDCVLLQFGAGGGLSAAPSYPGLRLWPDSLATLFADRADKASPMASYCDKQRLPIDEATGAVACVDAIVMLQPAPAEPAITLTPMPPPAACMALIRNSFQLDLGDRDRVARQLALAADAAARVPILALAYPRNYAWLPRVVTHLGQRESCQAGVAANIL